MALGATFIDLSSKDKKELNINSGIKIQTLGAGKLKSIGLREGDVIVKVNNEVIETIEQLTENELKDKCYELIAQPLRARGLMP